MTDSLIETEAHVHQLGSAVARLKAFAQTFNAGDPVDEESGLMADDLIIAVEVLEMMHLLASSAPPEKPGT